MSFCSLPIPFQTLSSVSCSFLTYFMPLISLYFDTSCKHQKTSGVLMFSEGIKRNQRHEMGKYHLSINNWSFVPIFFGTPFVPLATISDGQQSLTFQMGRQFITKYFNKYLPHKRQACY